jgi:hypothetical protein
MTVKLFIVKVPRWLTAGVYLLMGWLSIVRHNLPRTPPQYTPVWRPRPCLPLAACR